MTESNFNLLGQHFLTDQAVIDKMASFAHRNETILEIGPGKGVLTKKLLGKGARVIAVEIDESLAKDLKQIKGEIDLKFGDILEMNLPECDKIIASLPYHITEPLIDKLTKSPKEAIFLVGNHFAKTATAKANDEEFSKLSLLVQAYFEFELIQEVSKESFDPPPRVMSALIKLIPREPVLPELKFFRELFDQRDKKLKNALREAFVRILGITKNEARDLIEKLEIPEILELNFENLNNRQLSEIYTKISPKI